MRRVKGFTLIELLVVISIIGLLVSILVPSISQAQKLAKRAACSANLNGLGKAIALYRNISKDQWPLISDGWDMDYKAAPIPGGSQDVFALDGDDSGDGSDLNMPENFCLLVAEDFVTSWRQFRCPQVSSETMDRGLSGNEEYGFREGAGDQNKVYCDYALHLGYTISDGGMENAAKFRNRMNGQMVIAGDQAYADYANPGEWQDFSLPPDNITDNTGTGWNHEDDGINVLTAGYSVKWSDTVLCGYNRDNVYTKDLVKTTGSSGMTVWEHDDSGNDAPAMPSRGTDCANDSVIIRPWSAGLD